MSGPRIAIVGGGSYQWVPKLLVDIANTPALHDAEIVLEDLDPVPVPRMVELVTSLPMTSTGKILKRELVG